MIFDASSLWFHSTRLHARGHKRLARAIKALNYLVFRAVLPPEASLDRPVRLGHQGLGTVIHTNVDFEGDALLWHRVTLSVTDRPGSGTRIIVEDGVEIGSGAAVVTRFGESLTICSGTILGANAVLTRSTSVPGVYVGAPARLVTKKRAID